MRIKIDLKKINNYAGLFFIYLLIKMFYFFESGQAQVADFVIATGFFSYFIINWKVNVLKLLSRHKYLFYYFLVVILVNGFHSFFDYKKSNNWEYLIPITHYFFNILFFIFCLELFSSFALKHFRYLGYVIALAFCIMLFLFLIGFDKGIVNEFKGRTYLMFNNPNQLGYYCLLLSTIFVMIDEKINLHYIVGVGVMAISFILIFNTRTRPAILGVILLIICSFYKKKDSIRKIVSFVIIITLILLITKINNLDYSVVAERFERLSSTKSEVLLSRGFSRIFQDPLYLIFGSGEGNFGRFANLNPLRPQEVHSGFLGLWFYYGLLGLLFFSKFIYLGLRRLEMKYLILLAPVIFHNFFHNGFRFSIFWVLLALCFYYANEVKNCPA